MRRGADCGPGRYAIAAHEYVRRGAGAAHGFFCANRAQHAAFSAGGDRDHACSGPVGGIVLCGAADARADARGVGAN